jgi:hypothetical protein
MPVTCPNCQSVVPAADVELSTRLAKCRGCDEVFTLDVPAAASPPADGVMPPVPDGVVVFDDGFTRRLKYRWFSPVAFFLLFFCVAWDSFLVVWYSAAFGGAAKGAGGFEWLMVVFPVGHVAVGVGLTYFTLCLFVNRTTVSVGERLRVEHGPLFWPGQVSLPAEAVTAVYCEEVVSHGKRGRSVSYAVKAVADGGRAVTLLGTITELPRAKFFERKVEEWLGLPPTAVPGEAL